MYITTATPPNGRTETTALFCVDQILFAAVLLSRRQPALPISDMIWTTRCQETLPRQNIRWWHPGMPCPHDRSFKLPPLGQVTDTDET